jgi:hypothetical protein
MRFKLINESAEKTFALVFDKGDEIARAQLNFTHTSSSASRTALLTVVIYWKVICFLH